MTLKTNSASLFTRAAGKFRAQCEVARGLRGPAGQGGWPGPEEPELLGSFGVSPAAKCLLHVSEVPIFEAYVLEL